jgi:hypothetical protein
MLLLIFTAANAIGAVLAAVAAFRSAAAAKVSAEHAREVERRNVLREVLVAATEIVAEGARVKALIGDLKREIQTQAGFAGQSGGGRGQARKDELDKIYEGIQPQLAEAEKFGDAGAMQASASSDDLTLAAAKLRVGNERGEPGKGAESLVGAKRRAMEPIEGFWGDSWIRSSM